MLSGPDEYKQLALGRHPPLSPAADHRHRLL
jgi:hypothetical protein